MLIDFLNKYISESQSQLEFFFPYLYLFLFADLLNERSEDQKYWDYLFSLLKKYSFLLNTIRICIPNFVISAFIINSQLIRDNIHLACKEIKKKKNRTHQVYKSEQTSILLSKFLENEIFIFEGYTPQVTIAIIPDFPFKGLIFQSCLKFYETLAKDLDENNFPLFNDYLKMVSLLKHLPPGLKGDSMVLIPNAHHYLTNFYLKCSIDEIRNNVYKYIYESYESKLKFSSFEIASSFIFITFLQLISQNSDYRFLGLKGVISIILHECFGGFSVLPLTLSMIEDRIFDLSDEIFFHFDFCVFY